MSVTLPINEVVESVSITHKFDKPVLKFLNTSDVENGKIINVNHLPIEDLKGQAKKTIKKYDILFSEIRPKNRRFAYIDFDDTYDFVVSTKLMVLRKFNPNVDNKYFYYFLTNDLMLSILQDRAENRIGSFPQITFDLLSEYSIRVPHISEQNKIAAVLSALDSKIELNNRINAELESMAKTIYDYWFVQFDFPDKNGKPYKTSGGKMVWNEELKREIPEGWEVNRFGEVVIIKNGKDHKHLKSGSFPVYGSGGVMRYVNEYLYDSESILIPRKGSLGNLFYLNQPFWSVDTIFYTQMKFAHSCKYLFYTTQNFNISKMNTGTAVPSMTAGILNNLSLVFPSEDILKRFDDILNPIFKNKDVLIKESEELTSLRDWLLPMLMNGQVRVS